MGYTHYWRCGRGFSKKQWESFIVDAKKILDAVQNKGIALCEEYDAPNSPPIINEEKVFFNGPEDDGHETFVLKPHGKDFDFCKTAQKDYDIAVCGVLVVAKLHFGDRIEISSDGTPAEWRNALELTRATLGKGDFPFTRKEILDGIDESELENLDEPYVKQRLKEYDEIRKALNIADD